MSQVVSIQVSNSYRLDSYDSDYELSTSSSNLLDACDGDLTTYASLFIKPGRSVESHIYYNFQPIIIPVNAYDIQVSCSVKFTRKNNGGTDSRSLQLYSGTTPMGSAVETENYTEGNTYTVNMNCGTWTRSQLLDAKLKFYGRRYDGSTNTTSRYIWLYEATMTVSYTYDETQYEINCSSADTGICIGTQSNYSETYNIAEGDDLTIHCIGTFDGDIVLDGTSNITASLIGTTDGRLIQLTDIQSDHDIKIYVPAYVKSGNTWKKAKNMLIKQEGRWEMVQKTYIKDGGVWRECVSELEFLNTDGFKKNFIIKR